MKKILDDIRQEVEAELDLAEALSEIMLLIHTGTQNRDVSFENFGNAFSLVVQLLDEHVQNLDHIANGLIDFENDLKIK